MKAHQITDAEIIAGIRQATQKQIVSDPEVNPTETLPAVPTPEDQNLPKQVLTGAMLAWMNNRKL